MGRHAGWLTAASALAQKHGDDGPHLIYLPERQFSIDKYLADIDRVYKQHKRCIVALSEGVWASRDEKGKKLPLAADLMRKADRQPQVDAHGNIQLSGGALADELADVVQKQLKIKRVRSDTFGYLQRSFPGVFSNVDAREAREVGEKAAHYACWHDVDGSVVIVRTGDYAVRYDLATLTDIAAQTRYMPDEYINADGNGVTDALSPRSGRKRIAQGAGDRRQAGSGTLGSNCDREKPRKGRHSGLPCSTAADKSQYQPPTNARDSNGRNHCFHVRPPPRGVKWRQSPALNHA
jgi:hypothetical protein